MLRLIGKPYIARACWAQYEREMMDYYYRAYLTDTLGGLAGADRAWADIVPAPYEKPAPKQTPEEIKIRILNGLNGGDDP